MEQLNFEPLFHAYNDLNKPLFTDKGDKSKQSFDNRGQSIKQMSSRKQVEKQYYISHDWIENFNLFCEVSQSSTNLHSESNWVDSGIFLIRKASASLVVKL